MKFNSFFDLFILFVHIIVTNGRFYAGRIKPNRFEYPKHNGWMLPRDAKSICESDLSCGGFTFKGSYKTEHLPMEVYFFHFVPPEESKQRPEAAKVYIQDSVNIDSLQQERYKRNKSNSNKYLYWSTYEVERDHVILFNMKIENSVHSTIFNQR